MTQPNLAIEPGHPTRPHPTRPLIRIALLLAAWGGLILTLAVNGVFDVPADQPAWPTLTAIGLPVALFVLASRISTRLNAYIRGLDPVLLTQLQAWRVLGGAFLVVYAFGQLPGLFAWPAGLGDVAVGLAAPYMAWRLARDRDFLTSPAFRRFNYLGLADFVVAVATGIASRNAIPGLVDQVTTAAMGQFPLVLIPTFAVPAFIILHLIVLIQVRAARH